MWLIGWHAWPHGDTLFLLCGMQRRARRLSWRVLPFSSNSSSSSNNNKQRHGLQQWRFG